MEDTNGRDNVALTAPSDKHIEYASAKSGAHLYRHQDYLRDGTRESCLPLTPTYKSIVCTVFTPYVAKRDRKV